MEYIIYNGITYYFIEYIIKDDMLVKHFKSDNGNDVYLY